MPKEEKELYFLNTIRWVSAAIVATAHAMALVFKHPPISHATSLSGNAITYYSALGHPSVILFFVISGYLVGGSVLERLDRFDFRFYSISRFSRIYIALIPALLLMAGLDSVAWLTAPGNAIYTTQWSEPINHPIFFTYTLRNIAATLLCLENVIGGPAGSDRPLWSLGYEWFFYIVFPCSLMAIRKIRITGTACHFLMLLATGLVMVALGKRYMLVFWLIWVWGAYAKMAADRLRVPVWLARLGGAAALLAFLASPIINQRITDPAIGLGFGLFLTNKSQLGASLNRAMDHALAGFSYSLYIIHLPLMVFMMMLFVRAGITTPDRLDFGMRGVGIWLALIAVGGGAGYLFGLAFEKRTDDLRRFLLRRFKGRPPLPAAAPAL